jgi:hypothetical protein
MRRLPLGACTLAKEDHIRQLSRRVEDWTMAAAKPSGSFKFKKNSNIGANSAEADRHFLEKCFVDAGDIAVLANVSDPKSIVVGRTVAGKTALLLRLKELQRNVIEVTPFNLAVEFVSNSDIIRFCAESGVNMDPFFKLLWQHVFTVELIKKVHGITDQKSQGIVFDLMKKTWPKEKADQYQFLLKHGDSFWKETDERVKETTQKTESELKAGCSKVFGQPFDLSASRKWSEEQKSEFRHLGQEIVSRTKVRDLFRMFDVLKEELRDGGDDPYYLVIDDLDHNWVDDSIRYNMIYALFDVIKDFYQKLRNVKIVVFLRTDLIERVIKRIKGEGFQDEKVKPWRLDISWTKGQLADVLDRRVNMLVRDSYTLSAVSHKDLLPDPGKKQPPDAALQYMLDRTLMRPRDLISFFNYCIEKAVDEPKLTWSILEAAEGDYSNDRRKSLEQEWKADYPDLRDYIDFFKKKPPSFRVEEITDDEVLDFVGDYVKRNPEPTGRLGTLARSFDSSEIDASAFRCRMVWVLYSIGFLGIKTETYTRMNYVGRGEESLDEDDVSDKSLCSVHKMYWRTLGIHDKSSRHR